MARLVTGTQVGLPPEEQASYEHHALELLAPSGVTPKPYLAGPNPEGLPYPLILEEYLPGRPLDYPTDLVFDGRLQMYGEPQAFYDHPATREVARFFGATNFIQGRAENGSVSTPLGKLRLANSAPPGDVTLTIRPEAVRLEDGENSFTARVTSAAYLGTQVHYELRTTGTTLRAALPPHVRLAVGEEVTARLPAGSLWVLGGEPVS